MESPLPILRVASVLEVATLVVMLTNLFTVHNATVSSVMGPLHGFTYLTVVICALLVDGLPSRARMLAWLPVIGGLLALRFAPSTG